MYLDADEHMEAATPGCCAAPRPHLAGGLLPRRDQLHGRGRGRVGRDAHGAAHLAEPVAVPLLRPHPRAEDPHDAHLPAGALRDDADPCAPLRVPEPAHRLQDKSRRNIQLLEQEAQEARTPFTDYNLGSEYLVLREHTEARTHLDRAWASLHDQGLQSVGYAPLLISRVARARREVGDHNAAIAAVDEGLALFPDHTDLVLEAAVSARSRRDLVGAATLAERCLEMGDAPADYAATMGAGTFLALALLAEIRSEQGDREASEELYRRCLREHPDYVAPVLPLVEALIARGVEPAEIDELVPHKVSARLLAGSAYIEAGRPHEAERWFRARSKRSRRTPPPGWASPRRCSPSAGMPRRPRSPPVSRPSLRWRRGLPRP